MMNPIDIAKVCLLLPKNVVGTLLDLQQVDAEHPRCFGIGCFERNQRRVAALAEAERAAFWSMPRDRRPVGMSAPDNVVWLDDLLRSAVDQAVFEITSAQNGRVDTIRRKILAWEDARQCAEDLGIRVAETHEDAVAELKRVGLRWIVDAIGERETPRFGLLG
jgi:hypothetical protein